MQTIRAGDATCRRNHVGVGTVLGKSAMMAFMLAHAPFWSAFTSSPASRGTVFRLEVQVFNQVVVNAFNLTRPFFVVRVGLALMQENAFDNAILLSQFRHVHQMLIRACPRKPRWYFSSRRSRFGIGGVVTFSNNSILQPATATLTTPTLILAGRLPTRCAKVVRRAKPRARTRQWWNAVYQSLLRGFCQASENQPPRRPETVCQPASVSCVSMPAQSLPCSTVRGEKNIKILILRHGIDV